MGTEAAWVPFVVAALGAGVNEFSNRRTAKKKDEELARGIQKNAVTQREANSVINQNLDNLSQSTAEPFKETLQGQFIDRINKVRQQAFAGFDTAGGTSQAFKDASGQAKVGAIDYGQTISNLLAGIDAAGNQRQEENKGAGDVGSDLLRLGRDANQDSFIAQLRAARLRNSPFLGILGAGLSGAAVGGFKKPTPDLGFYGPPA